MSSEKIVDFDAFLTPFRTFWTAGAERPGELISKSFGHFVGGSLVGVWNGWGYGLAIFRALNSQISEPEMWQKSLFLRNFRDFPGTFGL